MKRPVVVSLTERFDYGALKYIHENLYEFRDILQKNETELAQISTMLQKYMTSSCQDGSIMVNYSYANEIPGRLFAHNAMSLQGMCKLIRNAIACTKYTDIDFVNCHPNLLLQYCIQNNIPAPCLQEYCSNRQQILDSVGGEDAKTSILEIMNGGKYKQGMSPQWISEFEKEMMRIREAIVPLAPNEFKVAKLKKPANVLGSMVNLVLCQLENKALMKLKEFMDDNGFTVGVLVFDGCMIEQDPRLTQELLDKASDYIFQTTGYRLKIIIKDMYKNRLHVPDYIYNSHVPRQPRYAVDSATASRLFMQDIRDTVKICKGRTYVLKNNIWTTEPNTVNRFLLSQCMSANILRVRQLKSGDISYSPLTGEIQEAQRVVKGALALMDDEVTFEDRLWESSLGCLCFKDGIYDFQKRSFYTYSERPDVMTLMYIPRDFPKERPPPEVTNELMKRIFISTLGDESVISYYLAFKARALAGHYTDKQWAIMIGERNCGKGVLQELDKVSFPGYVNEVNANSFLLKQHADGDAAKALSWALDCEHTRITYTNELRCDNNSKTIKLDGNLLKAFQSGGDGISARKNYQDERVFRVATRLFMNANDIPEVTPKDALGTMLMFKFPYKFVSPEQMKLAESQPFFRVRDDTLKSQFCRRKDIIDAYTWAVIDAYSEVPPDPCKKVMKDTANYLMDIGDETTIMDRIFVYTGKREDFVTVARIKELAEKYNLKKSIIKDRLERMGGRPDKNCFVNGKPHGRGLMGVYERSMEECEDMEDIGI